MSRDALVVGIGCYEDEKKFPHLAAAVTDAKAIAHLLETRGDFQVKKVLALKKPTVTVRRLKDALVQLFKPEGKQFPDTALFYFSGHGIRENCGITEGYLATSNVDRDRGVDGLSLQWLRRLLEESPIRQQIVWLDCCHSGELLEVDEANPGEKGKARDRCFIAASRSFEEAFAVRGESHSLLTGAIVQGLEKGDRGLTNYDLVSYLDRSLQNAPQRPIYTNFGEPIRLILGEAKKVITQPQETEAICPYKGLQYFDRQDARFFFGRSQLTDTLIDTLGAAIADRFTTLNVCGVGRGNGDVEQTSDGGL